MRWPLFVGGCLAVVSIMPVPATARPLENWPYEKLFKEADLVVIATAGETNDTKDRLAPKIWDVEFIGQETQFVVNSILKGKLGANKKLTVLHYRLPKGVSVANGPLLVRFRNKGLKLNGNIGGKAFEGGLERPEYMLFLRLRPNSRHEPISGEIDPALSVREMYSAAGIFQRFLNR